MAPEEATKTGPEQPESSKSPESAPRGRRSSRGHRGRGRGRKPKQPHLPADTAAPLKPEQADLPAQLQPELSGQVEAEQPPPGEQPELLSEPSA
ncbi:MAG TPA: hypothetical protein VNZ22_14275, partial [Bacillota bacterium]|nr:hypothetical protein [Bacillota bacterium]